jgi:hypothetical protein
VYARAQPVAECVAKCVAKCVAVESWGHAYAQCIAERLATLL